MIVVHGRESALVEHLVEHLTSHGHAAEAVAFDAHLFSEVTDRRARLVVGVAVGASAAEQLEEVASLTSAAASPSAPSVVLLTSADPDSEALSRLKRHGAPYVVIRANEVFQMPDVREPSRSVWLSRDVDQGQAGAVTVATLFAAVERAVRDDAGVGADIEPTPEPWRCVLERAGIAVRAVPNWAARAAAYFGLPAIYLDSNGAVAQSLNPVSPGAMTRQTLTGRPLARSSSLALRLPSWRWLLLDRPKRTPPYTEAVGSSRRSR